MDDEERLSLIDKQLKVLPHKPGVYQIFDIEDKLIYVGRAKDLSNRVRSHFAKSTDFSKSRMIREKGVKIVVHQVSTENEAILLEYNMIQEYQPVLNEKWKDGKTYPYMEITAGERFPRIGMTREKTNPDSIYLGPFSDVGAVKRSLRYIYKLFPVADCKKEIHLGDANGWAKTCIRRRTRLCHRPCEVEVSEQSYREDIQQVIRFIEGKLPEIVKDLELQMKEAAKLLQYEVAAKYRDTIKSINRTMEKQNVFLDGIDDCYIIIDERTKHEICLTLQKVVDNRIVRRDSQIVAISDLNDNFIDLVNTFIISMLNLNKKNTEMIRIIVGTTEREKVIANLRELQIPIDRELSDLDNQLIEMTRNHARRNLQRRLLARKNRELPSDRVADLQTLLDLDIPPLIIDTFDVSTLMGTNNVGSCIRFVNGKPLKKGYTRFKVNTVMQQDDFASMEEIVYRRYHKVKNGVDSRGLPIPDLIVIDGGREQLKRAGISLDKLHLDIPHIGLAKREEEIYFANRMTPLNLDNSRPGILLLRACRDEAHRFAVSYQKQLRQKVGMESILDKIEGIGPKRKNQLLMKYKTVATLAKESSETVSSTIGISQKLASDVILACRNFITLEENRWKT